VQKALRRDQDVGGLTRTVESPERSLGVPGFAAVVVCSGQGLTASSMRFRPSQQRSSTGIRDRGVSYRFVPV